MRLDKLNEAIAAVRGVLNADPLRELDRIEWLCRFWGVEIGNRPLRSLIIELEQKGAFKK